MQIVIDIPEEVYTDFIECMCPKDISLVTMSTALVRGTILPKGHSRLWDERTILKVVDDILEYNRYYYSCIKNTLKNWCKPVLEADKEVK